MTIYKFMTDNMLCNLLMQTNWKENPQTKQTIYIGL